MRRIPIYKGIHKAVSFGYSIGGTVLQGSRCTFQRTFSAFLNIWPNTFLMFFKAYTVDLTGVQIGNGPKRGQHFLARK